MWYSLSFLLLMINASFAFKNLTVKRTASTKGQLCRLSLRWLMHIKELACEWRKLQSCNPTSDDTQTAVLVPLADTIELKWQVLWSEIKPGVEEEGNAQVWEEVMGIIQTFLCGNFFSPSVFQKFHCTSHPPDGDIWSHKMTPNYQTFHFGWWILQGLEGCTFVLLKW